MQSVSLLYHGVSHHANMELMQQPEQEDILEEVQRKADGSVNEAERVGGEVVEVVTLKGTDLVIGNSSAGGDYQLSRAFEPVV
jgi:hypothetical protein